MKGLLEAGVHFGHQTRRWDPRMKPFIFTNRNGIHIIDLGQTVHRLEEAITYAREVTVSGGAILFVGTKKQAQDVIQTEATRAEMPYVINRWLGGTLTNWATIQARIQHMLRLERQEEIGQWELLPKKEALRLQKQQNRLHRYVGGLRDMKTLPQAVFIVDVAKETIAIAEATRLNIPIIAICDTNCNPTPVTYPIPSNDDAIRAIQLITGHIADAIVEGHAIRQASEAERDAANESQAADQTDGAVAPQSQPAPATAT
jgi:small subunit ribosomal protein S2